MTAKNLSTIAADVIETYGITATNVINAYRFGGERFIGFVDTRIVSVMSGSASASRFSKGLRANLIDGQKRVSGYSVKSLHMGTDGAQRAVGVAVDLATKGISVVAAGAVRVDRVTSLNALDALNRVVMPAAELVNQVAEKLEEGSNALVKRAAGNDVPAKAVATRKLRTTTGQAAATRKQVTRTAKKQVNQVKRAAQEQVEQMAATRKRITRKATKQVNEVVAKGQSMKRTATRRVSKAVAETATGTSNMARRVARKAKATAAAA